MNGVLNVPTFNSHKIKAIAEAMRQKGLDVGLVWLKNTKAFDATDGRASEKANGVSITINNQPCIGIVKSSGAFNDTHLSSKETRIVIETLLEKGWLKKQDFSNGILCSVLHFLLLIAFVAVKWEDMGMFALCLSAVSITFIGISYMLWLPFVKKGQKEGKPILILFLLGAFLTVPSSLLHLVLVKALQKETLYIAVGQLFPDLLRQHQNNTDNARIDTKERTAIF